MLSEHEHLTQVWVYAVHGSIHIDPSFSHNYQLRAVHQQAILWSSRPCCCSSKNARECRGEGRGKSLLSSTLSDAHAPQDIFIRPDGKSSGGDGSTPRPSRSPPRAANLAFSSGTCLSCSRRTFHAATTACFSFPPSDLVRSPLMTT